MNKYYKQYSVDELNHEIKFRLSSIKQRLNRTTKHLDQLSRSKEHIINNKFYQYILELKQKETNGYGSIANEAQINRILEQRKNVLGQSIQKYQTRQRLKTSPNFHPYIKSFSQNKTPHPHYYQKPQPITLKTQYQSLQTQSTQIVLKQRQHQTQNKLNFQTEQKIKDIDFLKQLTFAKLNKSKSNEIKKEGIKKSKEIKQNAIKWIKRQIKQSKCKKEVKDVEGKYGSQRKMRQRLKKQILSTLKIH